MTTRSCRSTTAARKAVKLVKNATLKEYKGGAHGLTATEKEKFNADLLEFLKGLQQRER